MNIELEKSFSFSCVLPDPDSGPWINNYDVRLRMTVITEDSRDYNIAYGRIKHWFFEIMQDAVLCESGDTVSIWTATGMRCVDFPVYPMDQVIGLMLMRKLNAITENRIVIHEISVSSPADDFVSYVCHQADHLHWFDQPGWWADSGPGHSSSTKKSRNTGKVISINRAQDWKDHDLDWTSVNLNHGNVSMLPDRDRDA